LRTRNTCRLLCAVFVALAVCSAGAAVATTLHYKVRIESASFGKGGGTREFWVKGAMMRCDIKSAGLPITVVKNSHGVFLLHAWNKVAGKYPDGSPRGNPRTLLPGPTGSPKVFLDKMNATKLSSGRVGKQLCEVYSYTEPTTRRYCKLWVDAKTGKPVKLWMKGKHRVADEITATYLSFVEGARISDSVFAVPRDYVVRPMPKRELASKPASKQPNSDKTGT
jgi:hypothetical protein